MSTLLTQRQADELFVPTACYTQMHHVLISWPRHKAIVAYLAASGHPSSAQALTDELGIESFDDATRKKYEGLLEKKWTSVVRLQKKVLPFATPSDVYTDPVPPRSWT